MRQTPDGTGTGLSAADGGIFNSATPRSLVQPVPSRSSNRLWRWRQRRRKGYWLVASRRRRLQLRAMRRFFGSTGDGPGHAPRRSEERRIAEVKTPPSDATSQ